MCKSASACRTARALSHLALAAALITLAAPGQAAAEEAAPAGGGGDAEAKWPSLTVTPGLQMWMTKTATAGGNFMMDSVVGGTLKAHMTFSDRLGAHVRAAYAFNSTETPQAGGDAVTTDHKAMAVGAGIDFLHAIGADAVWYNTMGLGYTSSQLDQEGVDNPSTTAIGGYFVTGFDVTVMGSMGVWMDWGCQVVGPVSASTDAGDAKTWHIYPLGAGGMRFGF